MTGKNAGLAQDDVQVSYLEPLDFLWKNLLAYNLKYCLVAVLADAPT